MIAYIVRRLALIIPTLFLILLINFAIVQAIPGGPVEAAIARINGTTGGGSGILGSSGDTSAVGNAANGSSSGIDPALLHEIQARYGFDRPPLERLAKMMKAYVHLDFGDSYFLGQPVVSVIREKLPVSLSLGLWTTLLTYLIAIPLGIIKATRQGSRFDTWTSTGVVIAYAIPTFLFSVILLSLFAGQFGLTLFPLRGLTSDNFATFGFWHQLGDYAWHMALPVLSLTLGSCATATILTRNAFLGELAKQYVVTARAKGMPERRVLCRHVFRNAALLLVTTVPQTFSAVFLGGSLLIEVLFSLDGFGRMSYEAVLSRDYPLVFGSLFVFTLAGMLIKLVSDLIYMVVDPRIDMAGRSA